jgi:hypothetical protein
MQQKCWLDMEINPGNEDVTKCAVVQHSGMAPLAYKWLHLACVRAAERGTARIRQTQPQSRWAWQAADHPQAGQQDGSSCQPQDDS